MFFFLLSVATEAIRAGRKRKSLEATRASGSFFSVLSQVNIMEYITLRATPSIRTPSLFAPVPVSPSSPSVFSLNVLDGHHLPPQPQPPSYISSSTNAMLLARHTSPRQHDPKRREQRLEAERERGRSRTISPIALARRAALENAQRQHPDLSMNSLVALCQRASVAQQQQQQTPSPSPAPPLAESSSMALRREQQRQQRRAAAVVTRPSRPEPPVQPASGLSLSRGSFAAPPPRPAATRASTAKTATPLWVENTDDVEQDDEPLPLLDQMQRAYAAGDMHTARVIFLVLHRGLRLQFQPSSSHSTFDSDLIPHPSPKAVKQAAATILADDPRLAAVSEEDLSKVACGGLVVDEATLKELRDAERKDREVQERRQRAIREQKEMERRHKQIEFLANGRSAKRLVRMFSP